VFSPGEGLRAVGAMTVERRFELAPGRVCGVRFRPGMAGAFLKAPAAKLTDLQIPLEDLWGARARGLQEKMQNAASAVEALCAALPMPDSPPDGVERAIAAITAAHGAVDVDDIARQANLSPRQFRRRCLEATGLAPKHLCRVLRFRRARELAAREPGLKWSLIAVDAGYFDQAHLIRDFREFTGRPPMAVLSNTATHSGR
jgi:AraC-like DNA-binding protein